MGEEIEGEKLEIRNSKFEKFEALDAGLGGRKPDL
jgi:hypothetical protein